MPVSIEGSDARDYIHFSYSCGTGNSNVKHLDISMQKEAQRVCVLYIVFIQLYNIMAPVKNGLHQPSECVRVCTCMDVEFKK